MAISEELGQQNKMLDAMETDLEQAGEEMDLVTKKTKELIAKAGGTGNFCLIAALCIVVLILVLLLLYW
jgi:t-SNARE complex subunit (syntaxin)